MAYLWSTETNEKIASLKQHRDAVSVHLHLSRELNFKEAKTNCTPALSTEQSSCGTPKTTRTLKLCSILSYSDLAIKMLLQVSMRFLKSVV